MQTGLETSRLILRPFEPSDAQAAFEWFGNPVVMLFTPTGPDKSIEETRTRLASYQNHQKVHGFSKRLILERDSGVAIGDSGLFVLPEYGWVDLGFRFAQPYWGKGLATEVASAWVGAAFDEFRVGRLGAFVHPENVLRFEFWKNWGFTPNGGTQSWAWTQSYSLSTRMLVKDCAREGHRKIGAALHLDAGVSG